MVVSSAAKSSSVESSAAKSSVAVSSVAKSSSVEDRSCRLVICYEIIQTTALEKKVKNIISNYTLVRQEIVPELQTGRAYEVKAFDLAKAMVNTINKLLDLPVSGKLEDLYTPEKHEPKIEELKKNLEHMKEKERNWIANSAFMLLLICDVILNTLIDKRPNMVDVLEARFHSY